MIQQDGTV